MDIFIVSTMTFLTSLGISLYVSNKIIKKQFDKLNTKIEKETKIEEEKIEEEINTIIGENIMTNKKITNTLPQINFKNFQNNGETFQDFQTGDNQMELIEHMISEQYKKLSKINNSDGNDSDDNDSDDNDSDNDRNQKKDGGKNILQKIKLLNLTLPEEGIITKYDIISDYEVRLKYKNNNIYVFKFTILYNDPPCSFQNDEKCKELINKFLYESNKNKYIFENEFSVENSICPVDYIKGKFIHSYYVGKFNSEKFKVINYYENPKLNIYCIYKLPENILHDKCNYYFITLEDDKIYLNVFDDNEIPTKFRNITFYLHFIEN